MKKIKYPSQNPVPTGTGVVKLVARSLVITVIEKLARVEIKPIGPIFVLTTRVKNDKLLVVTPPCGPKTT